MANALSRNRARRCPQKHKHITHSCVQSTAQRSRRQGVSESWKHRCTVVWAFCVFFFSELTFTYPGESLGLSPPHLGSAVYCRKWRHKRPRDEVKTETVGLAFAPGRLSHPQAFSANGHLPRRPVPQSPAAAAAAYERGRKARIPSVTVYFHFGKGENHHLDPGSSGVTLDCSESQRLFGRRETRIPSLGQGMYSSRQRPWLGEAAREEPGQRASSA